MTIRLPHTLAAFCLALSTSALAPAAPRATRLETAPAVDAAWESPAGRSWLDLRLASAEEAFQAPPAGGGAMPYLGPLDEQYPPVAAEAIPYGQSSFEQQSHGVAPYCPPPSGAGSGQSYQWRLMPQGLIYRSYLAGAKESRFRSVWNNESNDGNIWDLTLGGNVGVLRYGTGGDVRPEGFQIGIEGAGLVRLDIDEERDVDAADFRGGFPLTWGDSVNQVKFAYYHLSSHVGDEFLLKNIGFTRLNYSRDVLVLGDSYYLREDWRVYGEAGYAVDCDVSGPWEFQFGAEWIPGGRTGGRGAPFAAVNGHLREEVDFGGNAVFQTGWAWRRSPASGVFRLGVEYYNGKDDQFSFFNESVEKVGFGMWYDY